MKIIDKVKLGASIIFRVLLLVAILTAAWHKEWSSLGLAILTLILTFIPTMLEKRFSIDFPTIFEIMVLVFIFASIYLGFIHSYYERFWWWDVLLHTSSGIVFGLLGLYLVYILDRKYRVAVKLNPYFVALFAISFAIAMGALWEILEFSLDYFFSTDLQLSLADTMWDLIVDTLGAIIVAIFGYFYLKSDVDIIEKFKKKLVNEIKDMTQKK
ncbi:MAG: hypothetical protein ACLFPQ_02565 [Candidatus Woesearchaeota archaeon]